MQPPPIQPLPRQAKKGWFSRNWKWFVPLLVVVSVLLVAGFVVGIVASVFGLMKSSDAYKKAVARVNADPQVISALGEPVQEAMFFTGNVNLTNDSGHANFVIPVSGPHGKGTLYVIADKSAGSWTFSTLSVEVEGSGQKIDLNNEAGKDAAPNPP